MRTNIDQSQYKKDFLNYADNDGLIKESKSYMINNYYIT
jgi:hypothetical protein